MNVVEDALSLLSIGSVAHVKKDKRELICDVHRLSQLRVRLVDTTKCGVMVHDGLELSFVVM